VGGGEGDRRNRYFYTKQVCLGRVENGDVDVIAVLEVPRLDLLKWRQGLRKLAGQNGFS
jgi:hypothetical protein